MLKINVGRHMATAVAATALSLLMAAPSFAAAQFPNKPITVLVPFATGSGSDTFARIFGNEITRETGQVVIVSNKPGADGTIATREAASAKPDGYTILLTSNTHVVNKFLLKSLPYDPIGDFKAIALYKKPSPLVLVVASSSPYHSLAELTKAIQENPEKFSYGSGNSSSRVGAELYKQLIGSDILYVPFKGNAQGLQEVAAGRVDLMFSDIGAFIPLWQAGKLRPLAVTSTEELPFLKGVPTSAEAGLPKLQIASWGVFLAPAGTPDEIVDRLHDLIATAVKSEAVQTHLAATNSIPFSPPRAQVLPFMQEQTQQYAEIIKKAGIEPK